MSRFAKNKLKALALLLLKKHLQEEEEEEEIILKYTSSRKPTSNVFKNRKQEGAFNQLIHSHLLDEEEKFITFFRLNREQFFSILNEIKEDVQTFPSNRVSTPISPAEKLAVTLRYLATGESHRSLSSSFCISPAALCKMIPQVLRALKEKLVPKYLPEHHQIDWKGKAEEFWTRWNFPNCISAVDGRHVRIFASGNSGSNSKAYFPIVLLAMVDANYQFQLIDVGSYGKEGDCGIFKKSYMSNLFKTQAIFPPPEMLPNSDITVPYVVLGDEAFSLNEHIMKPFCRNQVLTDPKKRNFNDRLSRARRVSENAFGIMCTTFRIFFRPIYSKSETIDMIINVCCCLHNILRKDRASSAQGDAFESIESLELPTENMIPLAGTGGFDKASGFQVRNQFSDYFMENPIPL